MNKRQKNKQLKKALIENGCLDKKAKFYCGECEKTLSFKNEFHKKYMACDEYCYAQSLGIGWDDFL